MGHLRIPGMAQGSTSRCPKPSPRGVEARENPQDGVWVMMRYLLMVSLIFNFTGTAVSAEKPKADTKIFWILTAADTALTIVDIQTQQAIQKRPGTFERNPLLPRRPTNTRMCVQFGVSTLAWHYLAWKLQKSGHPRLARTLQLSSIGLEVFTLGNNWRQLR